MPAPDLEPTPAVSVTPTPSPRTSDDLWLELRLTPQSREHVWRVTLDGAALSQAISFETPRALGDFLARLGRLEHGSGLK